MNTRSTIIHKYNSNLTVFILIKKQEITMQMTLDHA